MKSPKSDKSCESGGVYRSLSAQQHRKPASEACVRGPIPWKRGFKTAKSSKTRPSTSEMWACAPPDSQLLSLFDLLLYASKKTSRKCGAYSPETAHTWPLAAYRTKSVSGPIIHSFRNGYLVLWWSSSHTRPSPHFSGREASSALMPYRSLSRSTSASVGISRSVSAIVFGHSTCR